MSLPWCWMEVETGHSQGWYRTRAEALIAGVGQEIVERDRALCEPEQRKDHD